MRSSLEHLYALFYVFLGLYRVRWDLVAFKFLQQLH